MSRGSRPLRFLFLGYPPVVPPKGGTGGSSCPPESPRRGDHRGAKNKGIQNGALCGRARIPPQPHAPHQA